jgi:homopolymeric O-antigen transport system ATP-binding protein
MSDHDIAIRAVGLGKQYRLGPRALRAQGTLRDALAAGARRLVGAGRAVGDVPTVWALRDASFEVRCGDALGVVGANGAGKSTLLKLLSRITEPTTGHADVRGRIGSLLEVGTGFHPDLTGRENTYLNGAILGMRKSEIDRKFDEIIAFAEVEQFVDTPVKHYSSGMYMRLAFAVAAHLDTEILLVDEVLAVGDTAFQRKCLGKMDDVTRHGRTVLFVSHNMEAVQRLCTCGLWIERGRLAASGPIGDIVSQYRAAHREASGGVGRFNPVSRSGTGWARVRDVVLLDAGAVPVGALPADADLRFRLDLELTNPDAAGASLRGLIVELVITSDDGRPLVSLMTADDDGVELPAQPRCRLETVVRAPTFIPGRYRLNVFVGVPYLEHVDEINEAIEFEILPPDHPWRPYALQERRGVVCRRAPWRCESLAPEFSGRGES